MFIFRIVMLCLPLALLSVYSTYVLAHETVIDPLMSKDFGTDGQEALAITVSYPPGAATPVHRHDAHVFVYVLEGSITMQVTGGQLTTLGVGEMFYESPDDVHAVSKNASDTEPAKFLVFLLKDKEKPPVIPIQ